MKSNTPAIRTRKKLHRLDPRPIFTSFAMAYILSAIVFLLFDVNLAAYLTILAASLGLAITYIHTFIAHFRKNGLKSGAKKSVACGHDTPDSTHSVNSSAQLFAAFTANGAAYLLSKYFDYGNIVSVQKIKDILYNPDKLQYRVLLVIVAFECSVILIILLVCSVQKSKCSIVSSNTASSEGDDTTLTLSEDEIFPSRKYDLERLADKLRYCNVVGIDADWGCGKTQLIQEYINSFDEGTVYDVRLGLLEINKNDVTQIFVYTVDELLRKYGIVNLQAEPRISTPSEGKMTRHWKEK